MTRQGTALGCAAEVSERLVGSTAFKAAGTGDPRPAGSIPVHLRQQVRGRPPTSTDTALTWAFVSCGPSAPRRCVPSLLSRLLSGRY